MRNEENIGRIVEVNVRSLANMQNLYFTLRETKNPKKH